MKFSLTDIICSKHPDTTINYLCVAEGCHQQFLCQSCFSCHAEIHRDSVKELNFFGESDICRVLEKIKNANISANWAYQQKTIEPEKVFEEIRQRIEETITRTRNEVMEYLKNSGKIGDEKLVHLLAEFERFYQYFSTAEKNIDQPKQSPLSDKHGLESFLSFYSQLKNHQPLNHITAFQSGFIMGDLESLIETIHQSLSSFKKLIIDDKIQSSLSLPTEDFSINNVKPSKYVMNHAPVLWHSIELLTDMNLLAVGDLKGTLTLWSESESFKKLFKIKAHEDWISHVKYSPTRKLVISGSLDQTIKVYKVLPGPSLKLLCTLRHNPPNWIKGLLVLDEKGVLLSNGNLPNICVWDLNSFKLKGVIDTRGKGSTGSEMTYIPAFDLLAVGFLQGVIALYDLKTNSEVATINTGHTGCRINSIQFLMRGNLLVAGVAPGKIKCWKLSENNNVEFTKEYEVPGKQPSLIFPVKNEESLLVASFTQEIYSLNLETGKLLQFQTTGLNECVAIRVIPKKKKLIVGDFGSRKMAVMTYE